jgi:tetratricopeptide (TPR) repeat protein
VYSEIKDYGKALESYNKAIELFPDDETIWFNMGVVYSITKEYKKAIESYQKAIEINPRDEMIWNNLGYAYNEIREHGKAIESYQKAIELFSGDETVWFNLGILYGIIEEYNQAIKAYQKVVEIKPNDDNAWCNLGVLYSIIKKKGNAIKACQKAIELKPDNESAWNNLGIIYYQQMRLVDAKGAFLNAIKYSIEGETEDIAMYYSNLFEVHLALKETDDALSSIETLFSKPERLAFITKLEDSLVLLVKENSEDAVKKVFYKLLQICEANGVNEKLSALLSNVVFRVLRECQKIKPFRIDMLQHILEELFSGKPEFTYPLRFLNIGIRYFMKGEKEAIYEMSQEERSVFEKFTSAESKS